MKRKVVLRISNMNSQKCRTKALKIVVALTGVDSVALGGRGRDEIVVIGERIDAVALAISLRKSVGFTDVISVTDIQSFGDERGSIPTDPNNNNIHAQGPQLQAIGWANDNSPGINYGGGYVGMPNYHHNYGYDPYPRYN